MLVAGSFVSKYGMQYLLLSLLLQPLTSEGDKIIFYLWDFIFVAFYILSILFFSWLLYNQPVFCSQHTKVNSLNILYIIFTSITVFASHWVCGFCKTCVIWSFSCTLDGDYVEMICFSFDVCEYRLAYMIYCNCCSCSLAADQKGWCQRVIFAVWETVPCHPSDTVRWLTGMASGRWRDKQRRKPTWNQLNQADLENGHYNRGYGGAGGLILMFTVTTFLTLVLIKHVYTLLLVW